MVIFLQKLQSYCIININNITLFKLNEEVSHIDEIHIVRLIYLQNS